MAGDAGRADSGAPEPTQGLPELSRLAPQEGGRLAHRSVARSTAAAGMLPSRTSETGHSSATRTGSTERTFRVPLLATHRQEEERKIGALPALPFESLCGGLTTHITPMAKPCCASSQLDLTVVPSSSKLEPIVGVAEVLDSLPHVLPAMCGQVVVPPAVVTELTRDRTPDPVKKWLEDRPGLAPCPSSDANLSTRPTGRRRGRA